MLGKIIVRFMSIVLNVVGFLLLLAGTIGGGMYAAQEDFNILLGIVAGFVASFLLVVATCGLPCLVVEINNNLIRIRDELKRTP